MSIETRVKASWFNGMRTRDVWEILKISRAIVCIVINRNFLRLSASTPVSLEITFAFRFREQRPKIVTNYYQKYLGTKFK